MVIGQTFFLNSSVFRVKQADKQRVIRNIVIRETSSRYVMHMQPKKYHNVLKLQEFNRLMLWSVLNS